MTPPDGRRAKPGELNRAGHTTPDAILFDWDNTLIDGWAAIEAGLNAAFAAFGKPAWTRTQVLANVRKSLRDSFPEHFGAEWERARDIFYDAVHATHLQVIRPLPATLGMLDALTHLPLGVVSNKQGPLLRAEAAHLGWQARFRAVVGAGDAVADKPSGAPLHLALGQMGLSAGPHIWYVGDTAIDMQAARAAGCVAVLLGDAEHDGGIAACAPDMAFSDGLQLAARLHALDK
ncbi:HAD family hydrolase [Sediminicoccus sp. KRV36]|uniref:HAD family hydrolase n=1 Tax=Sediminicoccus sp. KRV36 TaxID=3133721 RepID=UPI00200E38C4|nr:HAD family hydrolase [Sediminicoccus rosea]UPY35407.1 HAD family hydrolase [Sediminicoccus rosea]